MAGGVQMNVVPNEFTVGFDIRITPTTNMAEFEAQVNYTVYTLGYIKTVRYLSGSCQAVVRQLSKHTSGSFWAVIRNLSDCRQVIVRQL